MRKRSYVIDEMTTSGAVPSLVRPLALIRRVYPSSLSGVVRDLKKKKKRLLKRFSKDFSPPLPPKV
jgi:hypothetical protein